MDIHVQGFYPIMDKEMGLKQKVSNHIVKCMDYALYLSIFLRGIRVRKTERNAMCVKKNSKRCIVEFSSIITWEILYSDIEMSTHIHPKM